MRFESDSYEHIAELITNKIKTLIKIIQQI